MITLWMKVTLDKYELPVAVADTSGQLAHMIGVAPNNIHSAISNARKGGYRCQDVKVEIEEDDL